MTRDRATKLKSVTSTNPCAICGGNHKCSRGEDGLVLCGRKSGHVFGFVYLGQAKKDDQFALYRREGDPLLNSDKNRNGHHAKHWSGKATNGQAVNWTAKAEGFRQALTAERRGELAQALGLPEHVLVSLNHLGFSPKGFHEDYFDKTCWTFPEVDAAGHVIGINCRYADGAKKVMSGGHRGLTMPDGWRDRPGLVLCPEGPSDTLAITALGLAAIGRPNDKGGIELLAALFRDLPPNRQIIILGEYDPKPDGRWPGRDGAVKVANELAERLQRTVHWALPPGGIKDVRRWVNERQMDLTCADEWQTAGEVLRTELEPQEAKATDQQIPESLAVVRTLADVTARPIEWLWRPWIPLGAITLLDGDPGLGKSTITIDLAARVTRGWAMPPVGGTSADSPGGVLLLGAEDNLEYTTRPRLDAAGADVSRVHALEAIQTAEGERPPVLPWDLSLVERMIAERDVRLVVVDPFMAFLDGELDAHRDQDVRRCMHRLKLLAEKFNVAILIIRHLNKLIGGPALYRGGGSIGITGAVRSAFVVGKNPNDQQQCVLAPVKCNLAAKPKSLLYAVETVGEVSRIGWLGETELQADDVLAHSGGRKRKTTGEQCAGAIRVYLADGPKETEGMDAWLKQHGYTEYAIKAGRRLAGVKVQRVGYGAEGKWMAELSESERAGEQDEDPLPP
jgi:phage/plasmid primase-like uncharacterized protein